jgi:hypothetical protein
MESLRSHRRCACSCQSQASGGCSTCHTIQTRDSERTGECGCESPAPRTPQLHTTPTHARARARPVVCIQRIATKHVKHCAMRIQSLSMPGVARANAVIMGLLGRGGDRGGEGELEALFSWLARGRHRAHTHRSIISRETFFTVLVRTRPEQDRDRETEMGDGVTEECASGSQARGAGERVVGHRHMCTPRSSLHPRCVCSHRNKHYTADEKETNGGKRNTSRRATGCCLLCASHLPHPSTPAQPRLPRPTHTRPQTQLVVNARAHTNHTTAFQQGARVQGLHRPQRGQIIHSRRAD